MAPRLPCPLCDGTYASVGSLRHHLRDTHRTKLSLILGIQPRAKHTHCPWGHEWTEDNVYSNPSRPGVRHCRECRRRYEKEKRRPPDPISLLTRLELTKEGNHAR